MACSCIPASSSTSHTRHSSSSACFPSRHRSSRASVECWTRRMADRRSRFVSGRHAGVLVPLFSIPSRASWGIGEISDLPRFAQWLARAGLDFVQLLPVNEMQEGQSSPYSALSAMAIDPIFISLPDVEEFVEAGGEA